MNPFRVAAGAVEETKCDPFPVAEAPPSEAERLRRLKVAAAAISGSARPMRCAADKIVERKYGGDELESVVDEAIAVMLVAIEQWRQAR